MAILHKADLVPTKLKLLSEWVPSQAWAGGPGILPLGALGAFRLDDPDGAVGMETHILKAADGRVFHVPVTYRGSPSPDATGSLVGTTQHSVLGQRWVYDGCADPVYAQALGSTILNGGRQADMYFQTEDGLQKREATTYAWGTGTANVTLPSAPEAGPRSDGRRTLIHWGDCQLIVLRELGTSAQDVAAGAPGLLATWPGQDDPVRLAWVVAGEH